MRQRNVTVHEMFLELDFMVYDGVAPALLDPPEFKIKLVREFTEGNRPALPDWFSLVMGMDAHTKIIQGEVKQMQASSRKLSDGELLFYCRFDRHYTGFIPLRLVKTWSRSEAMLSSHFDDLIAMSRVSHRENSQQEKSSPPDAVRNC